MFAQDLPTVIKPTDESRRNLLVRAAREYLGVPYLSGGTTVKGMDCSGFVFRAAMDGLDETYPRTVAGLVERSRRINDQAREPGDLLFFNTTGRLTHVGIYLGGSTFIHAASDGPRTGVILSDLSETYWKRAYAFTGRILPPESIHDPSRSDLPAPVVNPFPFEGDIGLRLNLTGGALWDFMPNETPLRGVSMNAELTWVKGLTLYPGVGTGLVWDSRSGSMSIPITVSITTSRGFRFFIGTQLHGTADRSLDRTPQFPGILGLSWNSKPVDIFDQNVRFYQSAEYSVFPDETYHTGLRFNTGLTVSLDL